MFSAVKSLLTTPILGGSVAEWWARWTSNPAVPGSSPALATCWICSRDKSSSTLVKSQLVASCQLGFLILLGWVWIICFYVSESSACKRAGEANYIFHYDKQAFKRFFKTSVRQTTRRHGLLQLIPASLYHCQWTLFKTLVSLRHIVPVAKESVLQRADCIRRILFLQTD